MATVNEAEGTHWEITGIELIAAERSRQIQIEGWDVDHDDQHQYGDLAVIAAALAVNGTDAVVCDPFGRGTPKYRAEYEGEAEGDSWGLIAKHGDDEVRSLVIAGALIAAEIDRVLRKDAAAGKGEVELKRRL